MLQQTPQNIIDADTLRRAKALLQQKGRCQGRFTNPKGEVCLAMAIYQAAGGTQLNMWGDLVGEDRDTVLRIERVFKGGDICSFNNRSSDEEVFAAIDNAVARLEAASC